jgi:hypothetical protein
MADDYKILDSPGAPVPRAVSRRVGISVVVLFAALFGWAVFKHLATGGLVASEIDAGMNEVAAAISSSDPVRYQAAEEHFKDAASVSVLDAYPAFLISVGRRLQQPGDGPQDKVAAAVVAGDLAHARELVSELGAGSEGAAKFWLRFLDELEQR